MLDVLMVEGFTNRFNSLVSTQLKNQPQTKLRWLVNQHCPVEFSQLFTSFDNVVVERSKGTWRFPNYQLGDSEYCFYFLYAPSKNTTEVLYKCLEVDSHIKLEPFSVDENTLFVHARTLHLHHACADIKLLCKHAISLAEQHNIPGFTLLCDQESGMKTMKTLLEASGKPVHIPDELGYMENEFDRDEKRCKNFIRYWRGFSHIKHAITNSAHSTILDFSRILGNKVWTLSDCVERARIQDNCFLFKNTDQIKRVIPT